MMKVWMAAALVIAPVLASSAAAQDTTTSAEATTASAEAPKKEKLICRVDRATGSRVRVNRVCMTREQWDESQRTIRSGINNMTQNTRGTNGGNPMGPN